MDPGTVTVRRRDTTKGPPLRILSLGTSPAALRFQSLQPHLLTQILPPLSRWRGRSRLLNACHHPGTHVPHLRRM